MRLNFTLSIPKNKNRCEIFDVKNASKQLMFHEATNETNILANCFKNGLPFVDQTKKFKEIFFKIF